MINQDDEKRRLEQIRLTTIWLSPDVYRKLLQVEGLLMTKRRYNIDPSFTVKKLIEFWDMHHTRIRPVPVVK